MNELNKTSAWRRFLVLPVILAGLSACVTTTTGGFNVDTSDEQAVQDYIQLDI